MESYLCLIFVGETIMAKESHELLKDNSLLTSIFLNEETIRTILEEWIAKNILSHYDDKLKFQYSDHFVKFFVRNPETNEVSRDLDSLSIEITFDMEY